MRHPRILSGILILLVVAAVAAAQSSAKRSHPSMDERRLHIAGGPHGACRGLIEALALTPEQRTALDTLRQQTRTSMLPVADQIHTLHKTVEQNLESANPDRCAIGDQVIRAHGLHDQVESSLSAAAANFISGLTEQQRASYDAFIQANPDCSAAALLGPHAGGAHWGPNGKM
jgi:Spy/CpxP family protein refolding chaperone